MKAEGWTRRLGIMRYEGRHTRPRPRRRGSPGLAMIATLLATILLITPAAFAGGKGAEKGGGHGNSGGSRSQGQSEGKGKSKNRSQNEGKGKGRGEDHGRPQGGGNRDRDSKGRDASSSASDAAAGAASVRARGEAGARGGNLPCPAGTVEFKIDRAPTPGTYSDGTLVVTITSATPTIISWTSNIAG
jgi:hypothetical protein